MKKVFFCLVLGFSLLSSAVAQSIVPYTGPTYYQVPDKCLEEITGVPL